MSRLAFNRMLLAIHGQGDDLATPTGCNGGGCRQGRHPELCDCIVSQTELACDIGPDDTRVIHAPLLSRTDRESFEFWRRWSKLIAAATIAAFVGLLRLFGATSL